MGSIMINLSPTQFQIVNAPIDKPIQVLASAGTGKTRVLTERIRYILNNTKKDGVIALTFTNKAAEEMSSRLEDCDEADGRTWIATIHSVAQHILEKYGHTIGLPSDLHIYERDKDRMEVFLQSLREDGVDIDEYLNVTDTSEVRNREQNLQNFMDTFSKIKREILTETDVAKEYRNNTVWKIYEDYQASLINSGGIDYDDILLYAHEILLTNDWIAKIYTAQYKHICVDEAQDLNKVQYEFIKILCGDIINSILMVGDPNQMIYGFNGSSKEYLLHHFKKDYSPLTFKLKENYRSTKAVIRASNKLKPNSQIESEYALEGLVKIKEFNTEEEEANSIIETIQNLLKVKTHDEIEGNISLDKMVVIARNRFVFSKLENQLNEQKIPFYLKMGERQKEPSTKFGKVLDYAIRIKVNPKDWVDGKKLCQLLDLSEPKIWDSNVLSILTDTLSTDELVIKQLLSEVNNLNIENPAIPKFEKGLRDVLEGQVKNQDEISVEKTEEIKRSIEELGEFSRTWTKFKRKGLGESLVTFRNALALGQLSDDDQNNGLTLSTVHTMKGLEKEIVFLMGMCEGVFPDYRANTTKKLDEERNNAFVAVTRAKRWLYVSYPKQRMMPWGDLKFQKVSRFVEEMGND